MRNGIAISRSAVREGSSPPVISGQRQKRVRRSLVGPWGKSIPGRGGSQCKDPVARDSLWIGGRARKLNYGNSTGHSGRCAQSSKEQASRSVEVGLC